MRTTILTHRKTSLALGLMLLASMTVVRHDGFGANAPERSLKK
jgi:hypothetical protein